MEELKLLQEALIFDIKTAYTYAKYKFYNLSKM